MLTSLHYAALEWDRQRLLIRNGASKSMLAGNCGTPLHQAAFCGHVEIVGALVEDKLSEPDLTIIMCHTLKGVGHCGIISTCDLFG